MTLYKLFLIASLAALPSAACWADDAPPLPEATADTAAVDDASDPATTGSVDPIAKGEAEEVWMTPVEDISNGSCHHGRKQSTVYYTN